MKIMAVLNALRSPAFQAELGLTSSTGSSSPRDSDTGVHMASETVSLSSSMTGSEGHSQDLGMPPPPPPPSWSQSAYSSDSLGRDFDVSLNDFILYCFFFFHISMCKDGSLLVYLILSLQIYVYIVKCVFKPDFQTITISLFPDGFRCS